MTGKRIQRGNLSISIADRLRDMVFASAPDTLVGSLKDLAKTLDVGIVTVQQAARVLEHEGLLEARRGPGGGYYGQRPNAAALERSIAAYLRSNPSSYEEALNITSLLFNELVPAAVGCVDGRLRAELGLLEKRIAACRTPADCGAFENDLQDLLFRMVEWPLFKLLTVVTLQVGVTRGGHLQRGGEAALSGWKAGRERIISAILANDRELARFEADRSNRHVVMQQSRSGKIRSS